MINVLWNIINYFGLAVLALVLIGICILVVCGIICIIKQTKEGRLF